MEAVSRGGSIVQLFKKNKEVKYFRGANSRLFGNLTQLGMHIKSAGTGNKNSNVRKVYGKVPSSKCYSCVVYLYFMVNRGQASGRIYLFDYHNDFFGLARTDAGLSKTKSKDWNYPLLANKRENARIINKLNNDKA